MAFKILAFAMLATISFPASIRGYNLADLMCSECDCSPPQIRPILFENGVAVDTQPIETSVLIPVYQTVGSYQSVCYCLCGKKLGEPCNDRYDCQEGLFCTDRFHKDAQGKCRGKCGKDPYFKECKLYERCVLTRDGSPSCERMVKHCKENLYFPVCATNGERNVTFTNRCFMELHNIELRDTDVTEYRHQTKGACPGDAGRFIMGAPAT
ncbi:uncharacterized protein LOC115927112 [Strongylocentrotus purpuratus]|uniref:Kazal-like domain-containing protein n=1 Tax=Strongylocentrotus purpuratus TaxID=7668 RepID=A0A7M7PAE9_STRPU|nr:uncharacterized protein LOC115927112 [Strongylocentrotus purpuratus]